MTNAIQLRAGTKATPTAVFDACDQLLAKGKDIRNEDVLSITGGGLGTVGRLVKLFKRHQPIIAANDALDAEATISLVQALDELLGAQVSRSKLAVDDFLNGAGTEIAELSDALEESETDNQKLKEDNETLRARLRGLEDDKTRLGAELDENRRTIAEHVSKLSITTNELASTHAAHAIKLEQLNLLHQNAIATSLESQRIAMNDEHTEATKKLTAELQALCDTANARTRTALSDGSEAQTQIAKLETELAAAARSAKAAERSADERVQTLELLIDEKHAAIDHAQRANRELLSTMTSQVEANGDAITEQLISVSSAAESVNAALVDISSLLTDIQQSAESINKPEKE